MKRLCALAFLSLFVLFGCKRPGSNSTGDRPGSSENPAAASGENNGHAITFTPQTRSRIAPDDISLLEQINRENERVVAAVTPSIVKITAMTPVDPRGLLGNLPFKFPFHPGTPGHAHPDVASYGSGVIISRDGYIVTNAHVVADSLSIEVQLQDRRTFSARLVASDNPLDIAVLKVDAANLPPMPWGDSDKVEVGEQVFAIGNPFNLDDSVSKGIVSAKSRTLPESDPPNFGDYEDYIQTDASINRGNSGGALVNIHGELIGINAAIASFSGGNEGVAFSIPSNLVRYAVEGLLRDGRLVRGYLGVRLPTQIDHGVMQQLGIGADQGALLAGILRSSPADAAKLHPADFITAVDGRKISSVAQLRLIVSQIPIGKEVAVSYIRAGAARSATVKIAEAPKEPVHDLREVPLAPDAATALPPGRDTASFDSGQALGGLEVADLNDKTRGQFGVDPLVTSGVVITGVRQGSAAEARGLLQGDVIEVACTRPGTIEPLASTADFTGLAKKMKTDQGIVLLVDHARTSMEIGGSMFVYLAPPPK